MDIPLFYRSKPLFGLDIGRSSVKVVQLRGARDKAKVVGYGYTRFDRNATQEGEIIKPEVVAAAIKQMIEKSLTGKITSNRVVASIPMAHSYVRMLELPAMPEGDLNEAVKLEAEQYVPVASQDLYIEHKVLEAPPRPQSNTTTKPAAPAPVTILMVAVPKKIVTSYIRLFELLGLEVAAIEPNIFANLRSVDFNYSSPQAKVIIDFGSESSDLAVHDVSLRLASTTAIGGDMITDRTAKALKLTGDQAYQLKIRYGIAKSRWQAQLATALQPLLGDFANEVQKTMRYYHDHTEGASQISEIYMVGGGASLPGLSDFLTHLSGVKVIIANPWARIEFKPLPPPDLAESTLYATAVGLGLKELVTP